MNRKLGRLASAPRQLLASRARTEKAVIIVFIVCQTCRLSLQCFVDRPQGRFPRHDPLPAGGIHRRLPDRIFASYPALSRARFPLKWPDPNNIPAASRKPALVTI